MPCTSLARSFDYNRVTVAEWVRARIPWVECWGEWYQAIGLKHDDVLVAGVVYTQYTGTSISMSVAATRGTQWATPESLGVWFDYPFEQLQCRRVTAYVAASNKAWLRWNRMLGFKPEGILRHALPDDDMIILGMLRDECKHGKIIQSAA